MPPLSRRGGHLVVCGDGPLSYRITEELTSRYGERVTVILPSRQRNHGPQISALRGVRVLEAGLVLAVADGTPRNPLTRRRNPVVVLAGMVRRLVWHRFGVVFAVLLAVIAAGPEKVAQMLLTVDGMAFIPVITAIVVGARLTGSVRREQTLRSADLDTCLALVSVTSQDIVNLETALNARALREELRIVIRLTDDDLAERLQKTTGNIISRARDAQAWQRR